MLCYAFINSVISFKGFYTRIIIYKIWNIIQGLLPEYKRKSCVYLFVDSREINDN